jgi:hydroxyacylglutathione hydrolase
LERIPQISVSELRDRMREFRVLDVRRAGEWQAGHVEGALWHALDDFPRALPPLAKDVPIAVHCKSGYRSMLAASLLRRAGYENVTNVVGGFDAWQAAALPAVAA